MKLFEPKGMPKALITSLQEAQEERTNALMAFKTASAYVQSTELRFWELIHLAMPEYDDYFINVNLEEGTIFAESEK